MDKYNELRDALDPSVSEMALREAADRATIRALLAERDAFLEALKEISASPWEPGAGGAIALAKKAFAAIEAAKRQEGVE